MSGKTRLVHGVSGMAVLMLALSGCGGGNDPDPVNGGVNGSDPVNGGGEMVIGVSYVVSTNDRLVVISPESAEVRVSHSVSPDQRTVLLLSGRAELLQ